LGNKINIHNSRNKIALIAAGLLAIHPLHILASLQAAYEGSFLTLLFVLTIYCLRIYVKSKKEKWIYLTGIFFGLAILSKTSAILLIPPIILIYLLLETKKTNAIINTCKTTAIGCFVFITAFAIPSIITKSPALINVITQLLSQKDAVRTSIVPLILQYAHAIIWIGPIFLIFPIIAIINKKTDKLNLIAVSYTILFYLLAIRESTPPMERYLMILLPSLSILTASGLIKVFDSKNAKRLITITIITAILSIIILTLLNIQQSITIPFYPKTEYLNSVLNLNWDFLMPITGSSGPIGFYVNFLVITTTFISTITLFIISCITKNAQTKKTLICIIFGISIAYTLFFAQEYLISGTQPDINNTTQQIIDYVNSNNLTTPIYYFRNYALFYQFDKKYFYNKQTKIPDFDYFDINSYDAKKLKNLRKIATEQILNNQFITISFQDDTVEKSKELENKIKKQGGTIIMIDFPELSKKGRLWQTIKTCKQIKTFEDKGKPIGRVFDCGEKTKITV